MRIRNPLLTLTMLFALAAPFGALASEKPNFLIIIGDDCTFSDLPAYGGKNAITPSIDKLARQGLTFNHASVTMAMCQPSRSELYTGLYPMRNGCAWNHAHSYPETKSMPHLLGDLGYRVGLSGKVHVKPQQAYPFEIVPGFDENCVRQQTHDHEVEGMVEFMTRDDSPFALVIALVEPHKPWTMGDPDQYPIDDIELPENLVDHESTRKDFAKYLAEITYMDEQIGDIMKAVEDSGMAENTIVIFTSEQGAQWPGAKWTNYDSGIHTAFIASLPGMIAEGKRTDALIQWVDVMPTFIELAGEDPESYDLDGMSFADVLMDGASGERTHQFAMHNNIPEGNAHATRTVRTEKFSYLLNLRPDVVFTNKWIMGRVKDSVTQNRYWAEWIWESEQSDEAFFLVNRYMNRPEEELYDLQNDPFELNNLADDIRYAEVKKSLRAELDQWMLAQNDPGIQLDSRAAFEAAREYNHIYRYD